MAAIAIGALCSCGSKQTSTTTAKVPAVAEPVVSDSTLVLYYSQTGATKAVAEEIQRQLGCSISSIEALTPYDSDYDATIERWRSEIEKGTKVGIKPLTVNLDDYNTVFLGFPIWGGTYALPVATFLADNSLEGKRVVTFATFGSGGIDPATSDVRTAQPKAEVIRGYGVRNARISKAPGEVMRFLIEDGYMAGRIEPLPEYSDAVPVTPKEDSLFNAACSSYKYPLGSPVTVATRTTDSGTDYRFEVRSQTPNAGEATSTIYVTVPDGAAPEFTEVIRH
ncbi:MAG: hypothetical protein K2J92_09565 [Muribaculaceae bacterium]|nr:hypothetical protein [Muribaculaceae bacterium]MDE6843403.1 hypothetical protein [Muribaculaceae bacterium]